MNVTIGGTVPTMPRKSLLLLTNSCANIMNSKSNAPNSIAKASNSITISYQNKFDCKAYKFNHQSTKLQYNQDENNCKGDLFNSKNLQNNY